LEKDLREQAPRRRPTLYTDQPLTKRSRRRGWVTTSPSSTPSSAAPNPSAGVAGPVWVNTRSGKYFLPGSRYYGKTKHGEYMSEAEARRRGYVPAR
jgi:hypothetical protein